MKFYFLNYLIQIKHEVNFFNSIEISQIQNVLWDIWTYEASRLIAMAYILILTVFLIYIVIKG